jgi:hypothetical protein
MLKKIKSWLQQMTDKGYRKWDSPQQFMEAERQRVYPHEKMQAPKRQSMYCYKDGPMYFLGQQIVKAMQDAGYPAMISECYRSPERQARIKAMGKGRTNAGPWQSPHQYLEAVDIIHPSKGWNVSQEYWDTLATCARIVGDKYGVEFDGGFNWGWDYAHIELENWREFRDSIRARHRHTGEQTPPSAQELAARFEEVLPDVWKRRPGV